MKKLIFVIQLHDNTVKLQDLLENNTENPIYDVDAALSFISSNIGGSILVDDMQMLDVAAVAADAVIESAMAEAGPDINLSALMYNLSNWAVAVTTDIKNSLVNAGVTTLENNELQYTRSVKNSNGKLIYVKLL